MAFRLTDDEAWGVIAGAHTGILTSLRRDGRPIVLPLWFVARERCVYIRTPSATKQTARIRHDPRAHFLVEQGTDWSNQPPLERLSDAVKQRYAETELIRLTATGRISSWHNEALL